MRHLSCSWLTGQRSIHRLILRATGFACALSLGPSGAHPEAAPQGTQRLIGVYSQHLDRIEGGDLIWRDGTRMPLDDGAGEKPFESWLAQPDIEDMFRFAYPAGAAIAAPPENSDPGRARNAAFFDKMYGDCSKGDVAPNLTTIVWLPKKSGQRLKATRINGVADRLTNVSTELDALPEAFDRFLTSPASTYICRPIAGTNRTSAHGAGIAIDIAIDASDYWRWSEPGPAGAPVWRNRLPGEIVHIFERHGFIWGGRWSHFDTMHFEYRPELAPPDAGAAP